MSLYFTHEDKEIFVPYNLLAVDFEFITTKTINNKAKKYIQEIVEVGLIFRCENMVKEFTSLVRPNEFLKCKNKDRHSIYSDRFNHLDIEKGMDLREVFEKIKKIYIPRETIWISWGKAEYDTLKMVCRNEGIAIPLLKDDYMDLSKEFIEFYNFNQNISLDKALAFLKIPISDRHRALSDSKVLMDIIDKMFIDGYTINDKNLKFF